MRRFIFLMLFLLTGCGSGLVSTQALDNIPSPVVTSPVATLPSFTSTASATESPPTATLVPTPTLFPLPTSNAPIVSCSQRKPAPDDLFVVITNTYGVDADYVPRGLVNLNKYLPGDVVYGDALRVRLLIVDPLVQMIKSMQATGLHPLILSGYRSYYAQSAARQTALQQYPNRADLVSALPGHSEHQLGLAVDFGSPELADIVGDPVILFHSDFAQTSEGQWLADHAHEYGFSLSYPLEAYTWTGIDYEPWHYRYVGIELATYLHATGGFLTEFVLQNQPDLPCIP